MLLRRTLEQTRLLIPNSVTALAILFGYLAVIEIFQGHYLQAALLILVACLLDMLDGRLARMMRASTDFGVQFDSMADVLNYGFAPALLFYFAYFQDHGTLGVVISFLLLCAAAVRLARYNSSASADVPTTAFVGLPTTMSAVVMAGYVIFAAEIGLEDFGPPAVLAVLMAFLMVSQVTYEKKNILSLRYIRKTRRFLTGLLILASLLAFPRLAFFAWGLMYILYGLLRSAFGTLVHWRVSYKHHRAKQRIAHSLRHMEK